MKLLRWLGLGLLLTMLLVFTSCFSSSNVKIGVIIPQEGSLADYGYQIRSGIQMAYDEVLEQQSQGLIKKKYELIMENEDDDIERVKETFTRLKDAGVTAVIGAASSAATLALAPLANESKIILLSPASSSPDINSGDGDFVFRNFPSDTLEAQTLSNVIFQKCRIQKVLMVRARNAFSEGITFELLKFGRKNSTQIPNHVVKFDPDPSKVDFVSVVDQIVVDNPEAIFLASYMDSLAPLLTEIRTRPELERLYIFTSSSFLPDEMIKMTSKEVVEGVMFTSYHWDPTENRPEIQDFSRKFQENFHTVPTFYAATGYDAMHVLVRAIEPVNQRIADDLRSQLNKEVFEGILGETDFNKRGDVTRIPRVYRMVDGIKTELTPEDHETIKRDILTRI